MKTTFVAIVGKARSPHRVAHLITILCAFAILAFTTGCSRQAKVERHLKRGQSFFKAEQYDKAEIEFLNVLRLQSANAVALRHLGLGYCQQGKLPAGYAYLKKAADLEPQNAEVRLRLASILVASGKLKEARDHVEAVLARDPVNAEALMTLVDTVTSTNDVAAFTGRLESLRSGAASKPGFHVALGTLQLRQRRTNDAFASFERALSLDTNSVSAHMAMAYACSLSRQGAKAEYHLKTAADLAPVRSGRAVQYADFKLRSGDVSGAKAVLEAVIAKAPDYIPSYTRLAELTLAERGFDEAASLTQKALARDPGNYEATLLLSRIHLAKAEPAKALADLERVVTAYPGFPQAHYHLALAQLVNEDPAKATTSLQRALALDPKHADSILLLAEINIRRNDPASAIASLKQLIQDQPHIFQAHVALATAYRMQNDLDAAAKVYDEMIRLFPANPQPHFLAGEVLALGSKMDLARKEFETALQIKPDFLPAVEELVAIDLAGRHYAAASNRVQSAISKHPKAPGLHLALAKVHAAQTNLAATEAALSQAIAVDQNFQPAYLALARLYLDSNRHTDAIEKLTALLTRVPNSVAAWMQLALIHHQLRNFKDARDAYEKLLAVEPRYFPALNNLASLYTEQFNQLDRAYTLARSARDLRPSDPVVADTLGWILYKRGEYSGALPLLQEGAAKLSKSAEAQFHLGMNQYRLGDEAAARTALERALKLGEDFPGKAEAQAKLSLLSKLGESLNLADVEKQLAADPRDPLLLSRIASLYEQSGAFDKAATACRQAIEQNPRNVAAMLKLAQLYAGPLRDPAKALEVARTARSVAPDDRNVAQTLGRLAFQSGDYKWSLSLLEEAARSAGDQPQLFYYLAWARYSAGRLADANAAMRQAINSGKPFPETADARRFVEINTIASPTNSASVALVESALKQDPNYAPALFASAIIEDRAGNSALARERYQAILKRFPDFIPAHKALAILLSRSAANSDVAFQHALKAREALPNDPEVARALGIVSFHRSDYSRSVQLLKETSLKDPKDAEALYYLGMGYFHSKENENSRVALQQAVSLGAEAPFAVEARRVLAQLK
ncbi:MAG TPA: tetratricopeptide repeat protein [Blastocatellia bacterium]|nr:tetratricopeptide repeat protein [Blastocatellia bacterium]